MVVMKAWFGALDVKFLLGKSIKNRLELTLERVESTQQLIGTALNACVRTSEPG